MLSVVARCFEEWGEGVSVLHRAAWLVREMRNRGQCIGVVSRKNGQISCRVNHACDR